MEVIRCLSRCCWDIQEDEEEEEEEGERRWAAQTVSMATHPVSID